MTATFASWLFVIGLIALTCVAVGAWWLSFHLDDEDDVDRLFREDLRRAKARAAMERPTRWSAR